MARNWLAQRRPARRRPQRPARQPAYGAAARPGGLAAFTVFSAMYAALVARLNPAAWSWPVPRKRYPDPSAFPDQGKARSDDRIED